jgi:predicted  nucleic acid-binding Zn-ribbon protein
MNLAEKLKNEIADLDVKIANLRDNMRPIQREVSKLESERMELEQRLLAAERQPRVSDHAVIRYLERIHGFDFEKQRDELLTDTVRTAIGMGANKVKRDGYTLVIKDNTVVTVH